MKDLSSPVANSLDCWGINVNGLKNSFNSDGKYHKVIASVDLGSISWVASSLTPNIYVTNEVSLRALNRNATCDSIEIAKNGNWDEKNTDKLVFQTTNVQIAYIDTNKRYTDVTAFKNAMQGVILYYELATPVDEELNFYTKSSIDERLKVLEEIKAEITQLSKIRIFSWNQYSIADSTYLSFTTPHKRVASAIFVGCGQNGITHPVSIGFDQAGRVLSSDNDIVTNGSDMKRAEFKTYGAGWGVNVLILLQPDTQVEVIS